MKTISKGLVLDGLLNGMADIHSEMSQLFKKYSLSKPDLQAISESDRHEWYRLKMMSDSKASQISDLLSKTGI